jgi:transcriptional regulator with XRE-family HTH domain
MNLSELILKYRTEHSLSQRQLAARCNLSTGYVSLIEKNVNPQTGKRMVPTLQVLNKLATGMGMSLDELLATCDDMDVILSAPSDCSSVGGFSLTAHEQRIIVSYRAHPEMQPAVDRLLGIEEAEAQEKQA